MTIGVATIIECGSCVGIVKRYEKGFDGKIPDGDRLTSCPMCHAGFNWDGIEQSITDGWVALQEWKAKTSPKASWESISPMQFMVRVTSAQRRMSKGGIDLHKLDAEARTMIRISKGMIIVLRDGTLVIFPNGNDAEYQAWLKDCKTEADKAWLMMADKDAVLGHLVEREEGYDILKTLVDEVDIMELAYGTGADSIDDIADRLEALFKNPKDADYAKDIMKRWLAEQGEENNEKLEKWS